MRFPLFVSHRRLASRKSFPRACVPWALDSGGFSELSLYGEWRTGVGEYATAVRRYQAEIGRLEWAAIQDWMCEPLMRAKTGKTVREHQERTVASLGELRALAPEIHWIPVLQGWERSEYLEHLELYQRKGFDLAREPLVGLGSVCRRQATSEVEGLIRELSALGLRLHGFGFKLRGLERVGRVLASADSMAWSFDARYAERLPGCSSHKNCANCVHWARRWREKVLATLERAA